MSERLNIVEIHDASTEPGQADAGMTLAADQAGPGRHITLHFALTLTDGSEVDSNFGGNPARLMFGDGNLPAGFEACLVGLKAGEQREFRLAPEQAFGEPHSDNILRYPRYQFPADLPLEEGLMVTFADSAGNEQAGVVLSMDKQTVEVDFNHPLAGRELLFRVAIVAVEAA